MSWGNEVNSLIKLWINLSKEELFKEMVFLKGASWGNFLSTMGEEEIHGAKLFFRFMALWVAYNAFYSEKYYDVLMERKDQAAALEYAKSQEGQRFHLESSKREEYKKALEKLKSNKDILIYKKNKSYSVIIDNEKDFMQVLKYIYTIRCNLFHGKKTIYNTGDIKVVEAAYVIIYTHLENLLTKEVEK